MEAAGIIFGKIIRISLREWPLERLVKDGLYYAILVLELQVEFLAGTGNAHEEFELAGHISPELGYIFLKGKDLTRLLEQEPSKGDYLSAKLSPLGDIESIIGKKAARQGGHLLVPKKEAGSLYGWATDPDVIEGSDKALRGLSATILRAAGQYLDIIEEDPTKAIG
ncbi:MAG: hypothetical protein LBE38_08680 [Deltaproteobacteria bacterium]|jgi:hypothetical protein|nr:hypothetical protein [Deltaproteobacteria bacterium]